MKKIFSFLIFMGIFLFGVNEWGKTLQKQFVSEEKITSKYLQPEFASLSPTAHPIVIRKPKSIKEESSIEKANQFLAEHQSELKIKPYHELRPVEFKTPIATYVRYSVFEKDIPILDMGIEVEILKNNTLSIVQNTYRPLESVKTEFENISLASVLEGLEKKYTVQSKNISEKPVLYAPEGSLAPIPVFVLTGKEKGNSVKSIEIVVRATDGALLFQRFSRVEF